MTLARSLPVAANSSNDTASTRVLGEGAACNDSEPLVRSLTACHLPADTHSNDHAQTLIDEMCECCSAYYSRTSKTTRRLFSRDPAYRKPIRRRAVLNHDCYSFSDERHEMKRSDLPLLNADATLQSSRRRSAEIRPAAPLEICLRASTILTSQLAARQASQHDCRQATAALSDSLKRRALWQSAGASTCQDDHALSLPSGPHARSLLLVIRNVIFQSTTDERARPVLVE